MEIIIGRRYNIIRNTAGISPSAVVILCDESMDMRFFTARRHNLANIELIPFDLSRFSPNKAADVIDSFARWLARTAPAELIPLIVEVSIVSLIGLGETFTKVYVFTGIENVPGILELFNRLAEEAIDNDREDA